MNNPKGHAIDKDGNTLPDVTKEQVVDAIHHNEALKIQSYCGLFCLQLMKKIIEHGHSVTMTYRQSEPEFCEECRGTHSQDIMYFVVTFFPNSSYSSIKRFNVSDHILQEDCCDLYEETNIEDIHIIIDIITDKQVEQLLEGLN